MKKVLNRSLSLLLICCIAVMGAFVFSTTTAEAKSAPKLSAKYVTLAKGGTQKISLKNGKGSWSIDSKDIIKVKKKTKTYITVAPLKAGTATVTCKVGKKKLRCKVKVLNNKIGSAEKNLGWALVTGEWFKYSYKLPKGVSFEGTEYNKKTGKVTVKTELDKTTGETTVTLKVKALKPGRFPCKLKYMNGTEPEQETLICSFINGFRGKAKLKKTEANYKKWRKKTISSMVSPEMSTWEIIDAIGTLIATGKYSNKGGATGIQLWYGGNGTCVSGSEMMDDFLKDLGISSKVHFAGRDGGGKDIYGYTLMYAEGHKNVNIKLGGKKYTLNLQPESPWPYGTIKR